MLLNPLFIPETGVSVSLKDVLDATPAESQEESRVMQSIEKYDPMGSSSRHFDQATSIPAKLAVPLSIVSEEEGGLSSASAHPHMVEDELVAFTTLINKIHFDQVTGEDDDAPPPAEIFCDNDKKANTQFKMSLPPAPENCSIASINEYLPSRNPHRLEIILKTAVAVHVKGCHTGGGKVTRL